MYKIFEVLRVYMVDVDKNNDLTNEAEKLMIEDNDILNIAKWLNDYGISSWRSNIDNVIDLRNSLDAYGETHSVIDESIMKISNNSYVKVTKEYRIVKES